MLKGQSRTQIKSFYSVERHTLHFSNVLSQRFTPIRWQIFIFQQNRFSCYPEGNISDPKLKITVYFWMVVRTTQMGKRFKEKRTQLGEAWMAHKISFQLR